MVHKVKTTTKKSIFDFIPNDLIGLKYSNLLKQVKEDETYVAEFLENNELNVCDKCDEIENTYKLIWITSEDFTPKKGEIVPKSLYKKYDALCKPCYLKSIKVK